MRLFELYKLNLPKEIETKKGLEILGISVKKDIQEEVLNEISMYLFDLKGVKKSGEVVFDYLKDYRYYFVDFLKLGIDLNKQDISWWEFDAILEGIFLQEHSTIGQVLAYRTYKKPQKSSKTSEEAEHNYYMSKKRQYALKQTPNIQKTEENIRLMMNRAKGVSSGNLERSDDLLTTQK